MSNTDTIQSPQTPAEPKVFLPNVMIVGDSGYGKSYSLRNLDPAITKIIDVELKGLPFKTKFPRYVAINTLAQLKEEIQKTNEDPSIKVAVLDSFTKTYELFLAFAKETKKGFDIYSWYSSSVMNLLNMLKSDRIIWIVTAIPEVISVVGPDGGTQNYLRAATAGRELEGKIEKEFLCVLHVITQRTEPGQPVKHGFVTQNDGIRSAKTPPYVGLPMYMDNDINIVVQKLLQP